MAREIEVGVARVERDGEVERTVGQRVVHEAMLARVHAAMTQRGEQDAAACVHRWLTGDAAKVPGSATLDAQVRKLERLERDLATAGQTRDAAYAELARYCVEACRAERAAV